MANKIHKFEEAGLGKYPYTFLGVTEKYYQAHHTAPKQPGGTCDYCGTGIVYQYRVRSADGKEFVVGSECIRKADDKGLKRAVDAHKVELQHAKSTQKEAITLEWMADTGIRAALAAEPHPKDWLAAQGKTLLDWADWMMANAGMKGHDEVHKLIKKMGGADVAIDPDVALSKLADKKQAQKEQREREYQESMEHKSREIQQLREKADQWEWLIQVLERASSGDFAASMRRHLSSGKPWSDLPGRAQNIIAEMYAKTTGGRNGSKAFKAGLEEFWAKVEEIEGADASEELDAAADSLPSLPDYAPAVQGRGLVAQVARRPQKRAPAREPERTSISVLR